MSALRGMAAILAGVGTGMVEGREEAEKKARRAKENAWIDEQRGRQRSEWQAADKLNADLKDASATRETVAGTQTTAGDTKVFSQTPENAAAMSKLLANEAELTGAAPVQAPTTAMTGQMARGHQIGATAEGQNTGDAESQRVQDVYRRAGMRDKAMQEFTSNEAYKKAIRDRMVTMETEGVTAALGLLKAGAPEQAMDAFQKSGSVKLPEGSKFVQADGTDMFTGQPGKVWSVVGPDGKTIVADVGQVTAKYLGIADQFKFDADIARGKQTQANADRDYGIKLADLEIRANEAKSKQEERALRAEIAQLRASRAGSGGGAGGGSGAGGDGVSFDPYEGFDPKNAQAEATRTVDERLSSTNTQVSPTERARLISEQVFALRDSYASQNANRVLTSAFVNSARNAKTPQEIEAVRQQGAARGLSPKQMAALDPRFAVAEPKPATAPASTPMANFVGKPAAPAYTPPAGSPAAKAAENRARVQADGQKQRDQSIQAARSAASAAIASGDIAAGAKVQDMPGFRLLPDAEKVAIRKLVFGR